jgi:signal recognition particle receptor subunit beta
MALVNEAKREINAKIVYIGPLGAGKSTAIRSIYGRLKNGARSELKTLESGNNRMLFFDYAYPVLRDGENYKIRFHLYTLLSDGNAPPPWKMLLKGVDGVVFMADSSDGRMFANLESCAQLFDSFGYYGLKASTTPILLQCNKGELPGSASPELIKSELFPELPEKPLSVSALAGTGLLEGLSMVSAAIMKNLGLQPLKPVEIEEPSPMTENPGVLAKKSSEKLCGSPAKGFRVESAGEPEASADGEVLIPLRLVGGECGKSIDFRIKLSVMI